MAKQVYNTRGMTIENIKAALRFRVENWSFDIRDRISSLRESLDYELCQKDKIEREISYLEKFIARKEKALK